MSKSANGELTFTSVYYEDTYELAERRLKNLRKIDRKHIEIKAYIIPEGKKFRVLRKVIVVPQKI